MLLLSDVIWKFSFPPVILRRIPLWVPSVDLTPAGWSLSLPARPSKRYAALMQTGCAPRAARENWVALRSGLVGCCLGASRRRIDWAQRNALQKTRCDNKEARAHTREHTARSLVSPHFGFMDGTQRPRVNKRSNFTMSARYVQSIFGAAAEVAQRSALHLEACNRVPPNCGENYETPQERGGQRDRNCRLEMNKHNLWWLRWDLILSLFERGYSKQSQRWIKLLTFGFRKYVKILLAVLQNFNKLL